MSIATLSTVADSQHERIDAALQRAENATYKGSREAFAAYDELVAELTRHLFAMEVAVLPVAARSLPGGAGGTPAAARPASAAGGDRAPN